MASDLTRFGVVDDGVLSYAVYDSDEAKWDAVVSNPSRKIVQFVPVDHNIVIVENGNERSMCDGLLYTLSHDYVAFVEIKERESSWIETAIEQLASTVEVFIDNHGELAKGNRYAYACNPKHPHFALSKKQRMQQFYHKYGFRLLVQYEIVIK